MRDDRYLGEIYHHGIKGMKWGIRRSPEQLGHHPRDGRTSIQIDNGSKMEDGYLSPKGFCIAISKLSNYCLKPGAKHSDQLFAVGYEPGDEDLLFRDLETGFDLSRKTDVNPERGNKESFSIPMELGITKTRLFRTVWEDGPTNPAPRFVSFYQDRRLKEDD